MRTYKERCALSQGAREWQKLGWIAPTTVTSYEYTFSQDPDRLTNREFLATNAIVKRACEMAGVEPTRRQVSKFRNKKGIAYQTWRRQK